MSRASSTKILEVLNVYKYFPIGFLGKKQVKAVDNVSIDVYEGETLALVGESGSGKTTLGRIIAGLIKPDRGVVKYRGRPVSGISRKIQMIFQNPDSSLDPRMQVFDIVAEALPQDVENRFEEVAKTLELVGLNPGHMAKYPHELSGGEKQRVAIARAIASRAEIFILDEPVSALDASIRAQILNLLIDLQRRYGYTYILIDHDLGRVWHMSDRVAIMYAGKIVEIGETERVFKQPKHPYTLMLLTSSTSEIPRPEKSIQPFGEPPSLIDPPSGCRFRTRCPLASDICSKQEPVLEAIERGSSHYSACHFWKEL